MKMDALMRTEKTVRFLAFFCSDVTFGDVSDILRSASRLQVHWLLSDLEVQPIFQLSCDSAIWSHVRAGEEYPQC